MDLVGVVDGGGGVAEVVESFDPGLLESGGFLSCGFDFGESCVSVGEEDESVGESFFVGVGEFDGGAAPLFCLLCELFFCVFFLVFHASLLSVIVLTIFYPRFGVVFGWEC